MFIVKQMKIAMNNLLQWIFELCHIDLYLFSLFIFTVILKWTSIFDKCFPKFYLKDKKKKRFYQRTCYINCLGFISRTCIRRWRRAIWPLMKWRQPRRVRGGTSPTESPPVEQMPSDSCCVPTILKVCT